MADSGSISVNVVPGFITMRLNWQQVRIDYVSNSSIVNWNVQIGGNNARWNMPLSCPLSVTIGNETISRSFSFSFNQNFATIVSGTTTIQHDSNGNKTFGFSFTYAINAIFQEFFTGQIFQIGTIRGEGTGTLNPIQLNTNLQLSASSQDMGTTLGILTSASMGRALVNLNYRWIGGQISIVSGTSPGTFNWMIPTNLAIETPHNPALIGEVVATILTPSGQVLSTDIENFTATVPESLVPIISEVSVSQADTNIASQFQGAMIQGQSRAVISYTSSGIEGSIISQEFVSTNNQLLQGNNVTTNPLLESEYNDYIITITDSRGRTAQLNGQFHVWPYAPPQIGTFSVARCDQNGNLDTNGTYAMITVTASVAPLNGYNTVFWNYQFRPSGSSTWTTLESGTTGFEQGGQIGPVGSGNFDIYQTYEFRLVATDFFQSTTASAFISTMFVLIDFNFGGSGMAFGKVSEQDGRVEVSNQMPWYFESNSIFVNGVNISESPLLTSTPYPNDTDWTTLALENTDTFTENGVCQYKVVQNILYLYIQVATLQSIQSGNILEVALTTAPYLPPNFIPTTQMGLYAELSQNATAINITALTDIPEGTTLRGTLIYPLDDN